MPALDSWRLLEHAHGHVGWLAALALVHPAVLLRSRTRRADWAVLLAAGVVTLAGAAGVVLYPKYRTELRGPIFTSAPALGYLFERKEHLAFGAVLLAWTGVAAYFGAASTDGNARQSLRRAAYWAFVAAAAFAVGAACFGTVVASYEISAAAR